MAEAKAKETTIETLKNVIFMYSSVSRPIEQLNTDKKPPLSDDPLEFHSFEIKLLLSEAVYKKLKKDFKGAKNLPNAKEHEKDELLEKFDFLNEADLADDMVLVKFSQSCLVGKKDKRRPSFALRQIGIKGKVQDKNGLPIDFDTQLGNGTKGHFQFRPVQTEKGGLYLYPQLVCVTELIPYVGGEAEEDDDSLGLEELDETNMEEAAVEQEADKAEATVDEEDEAVF